jgi:putative membrane protein
MRIFKNVLLSLVAVLLFVFVLQNGGELTKPVDFSLDLWVKDLSLGPSPLYSVLLVTFFLGLLISGVLGLIHHLRRRAEYKRVNRLLIEKDQELNSLRNLPVLEGESQANAASSSPQTG